MFRPLIVHLSRDIPCFKMLAENSNGQLLHGLFAVIPNCRMRWWWLGVDGDAFASDEAVTMVSVVVRLVVLLVCVDFLLKCDLGILKIPLFRWNF